MTIKWNKCRSKQHIFSVCATALNHEAWENYDSSHGLRTKLIPQTTKKKETEKQNSFSLRLKVFFSKLNERRVFGIAHTCAQFSRMCVRRLFFRISFAHRSFSLWHAVCVVRVCDFCRLVECSPHVYVSQAVYARLLSFFSSLSGVYTQWSLPHLSLETAITNWSAYDHRFLCNLYHTFIHPNIKGIQTARIHCSKSNGNWNSSHLFTVLYECFAFCFSIIFHLLLLYFVDAKNVQQKTQHEQTAKSDESIKRF